jgi:hypothetical protein
MGDGWQRARANLQTEDSGRDALREQDWFEIVWKPLVVAKRLWISASHKVAGSEGIPDLENGARRLRRLTVSDPAVWIISKSPDHLAMKRECRAPPANCRSPNQDTTAWRSQLLNRRVVAFLVPNQFYEQTENHCLLETLLRLEPGRARRHAQIRFAF